MLTKQLSNRIKHIMKQNRMSQKELANMLFCSRTYLNNVINGKQENIFLETKILEIFGIEDKREAPMSNGYW